MTEKHKVEWAKACVKLNPESQNVRVLKEMGIETVKEVTREEMISSIKKHICEKVCNCNAKDCWLAAEQDDNLKRIYRRICKRG